MTAAFLAAQKQCKDLQLEYMSMHSNRRVMAFNEVPPLLRGQWPPTAPLIWGCDGGASPL